MILENRMYHEPVYPGCYNMGLQQNAKQGNTSGACRLWLWQAAESLLEKMENKKWQIPSNKPRPLRHYMKSKDTIDPNQIRKRVRYNKPEW